MIFEGLLILLLMPGGQGLFRPSRARLWYLASFAITAILALPLVLPMWQQTRQSVRNGPIDYDTFVSGSTILPLWLKGLTDPYEGHVFQSISFVGLACLAFVLVAAVFLVLAIVRRSWVAARRRRLLIVLCVLGVFSFLWAGSILVPRIIYQIPILNRFRWPYKLLIQFSLFLIAFASCGLDLLLDALGRMRLLRGRRIFLDSAAICLIVIQIIQFGFLYYAHPVRALRIHRETVPWSEPLKDQLTGGRILSVGFDYTSEYTPTPWPSTTAPSGGCTILPATTRCCRPSMTGRHLVRGHTAATSTTWATTAPRWQTGLKACAAGVSAGMSSIPSMSGATGNRPWSGSPRMRTGSSTGTTRRCRWLTGPTGRMTRGYRMLYGESIVLQINHAYAGPDVNSSLEYAILPPSGRGPLPLPLWTSARCFLSRRVSIRFESPTRSLFYDRLLDRDIVLAALALLGWLHHPKQDLDPIQLDLLHLPRT